MGFLASGHPYIQNYSTLARTYSRQTEGADELEDKRK